MNTIAKPKTPKSAGNKSMRMMNKRLFYALDGLKKSTVKSFNKAIKKLKKTRQDT